MYAHERAYSLVGLGDSRRPRIKNAENNAENRGQRGDAFTFDPTQAAAFHVSVTTVMTVAMLALIAENVLQRG